MLMSPGLADAGHSSLEDEDYRFGYQVAGRH